MEKKFWFYLKKISLFIECPTDVYPLSWVIDVLCLYNKGKFSLIKY